MFMSHELKQMRWTMRQCILKEPTLPDEVLQYREPVDPKELLAGLATGEAECNSCPSSAGRKTRSRSNRSKLETTEKRRGH